ncbi:MAG: hypothetical protein N4R70_04135 [Lactobacillus iners]|nr:hypothetical protein [Lactobacillus iners]
MPRKTNLSIKEYTLKSGQKRYYFKISLGENSFTYSQQLVDFIIGEIKKDPQHIVESLKNKK